MTTTNLHLLLSSATIYTALAVVMALLAWHLYHREQHSSTVPMATSHSIFTYWETWATLLLFAFVVGTRWQVGFDYNMYLRSYLAMQSLGENTTVHFEPLFHWINCAMARSGLHFAFHFMLWAAVQIALIYYGMRHRKFLLPWIALCIILGPFLFRSFTMIRQSVAECALVALLELIVQRKFWLYLLGVAVTMTVHKTAIIFLPLYFLPRIRIHINLRWGPCLIFLTCIVAGTFPFWIEKLFNVCGGLLQYMGYGRYYRLYLEYPEYQFYRAPITLQRVFAFLLPFMALWLYPKVKQMFAGDAMLSLSFRIAFVYICYSNLVVNTATYLQRPAEFIRGGLLVLSAYTLAYLWRSHRYVAFAVFLIAACGNTYMSLLMAYLTGERHLIANFYHSIFFM